jgi:universal stress protein A
MLKPTKILVPTDFSQYSDRAFQQALDIARQYKAKVFVLHAIQEDILRCGGDYCFSNELVKQVHAGALAAAEEKMQQQLGKFPEVKEIEVVSDIRNGLPYEAILEEAKERRIDLIVIASLGQSGLAKYLIGSVARNVLKGAKCPVLLTP